MVQIPLRRAHWLRAITLASPIKKLRPQPTERAPTAWHTNDEYKTAEASEKASASSAVANASENRILPIPTPVTGYTNPALISVQASGVEQFAPGRHAHPRASDGPRDRNGGRVSDIAPAMAAKPASRTITSRLASNSSCAWACSVLWPEPVSTASRHASSADRK